MTISSIDRVGDSSTTALGGNIPYSGIQWRAPAKPLYHVYLYNVSRRSFTKMGRAQLNVPGVVETDPVDVTVLEPVSGGFNEKVVKGDATRQYHYVSSFPQPILSMVFNDQSNQIDPKEEDVRRWIVDMINPNNITTTLDTVIRPENAIAEGVDYSQKGVFFSYHNPPDKRELDKAYARMEKYYKALLDRASTLELTDKAKLSYELGDNPDYAYAANYFGREVSWNRSPVRPSTCPNCGENKPPNVKFHMVSDGGLCVEPSVEAWQQVVRVGRRKYDDVPEEFQWKKEKSAGKDGK